VISTGEVGDRPLFEGGTSSLILRRVGTAVIPFPRRARACVLATELETAMTHYTNAIRCVAVLALAACDSGKDWQCRIADEKDPDFAGQIGCEADFAVVASRPSDSTLSGARSVKTIVDQIDDSALYFQNSNRFFTHYEFVSTHLSGDGLPIVPMLATFNASEYYSPSRRFLLGALTHYEGPDVFCYEIAPYDTATADQIAAAYRLIANNTYLGGRLFFHPTSEAIEAVAQELPPSIKVISTDELYAGIDYQALNLGETIGQLRFVATDEIETSYLGFRDIAVLDHVPNDISATLGIITAEFQTPLSHVNVLARNRGTPNMALRGAFEDAELLALSGKWVRLAVGAFDYTIEEVSQAEADAWWEEHRPTKVRVPALDLGVTDLRDAELLLDLDAQALGAAIQARIPAFGGKAAHYGALVQVEGVPVPKAFAVPVYYYVQFMGQNGFDALAETMIADADFQNDPAVRDARLEELRTAMEAAPVDASFETLLMDKLAADFFATRMRFRSSTNAEDLDGFTGAGLYESHSGDPDDPTAPVLDAVRKTWASIWEFRAFEERSYRGIDHAAVGMALLVHRSFPDEEANGVAFTNNPFDTSNLDPAFYVNVQKGEESVVAPESGVTTDQYLHYFYQPGQAVVFIDHSSLVPEGEQVLTAAQTFALGDALSRIHAFFSVAYAPADDPSGWWAMDVEFKFEGEPGNEPELFVKQARPAGSY